MPKSKMQFVIVLVGIVITIAGVSIAIITRNERTLAIRFLADITSMTVGADESSRVASLFTRYDKQAIIHTCEAQHCTYAFEFTNKWLYRIHLAPLIRLTCTIVVTGERLESRYCELSSGDGNAATSALVWEKPTWESQRQELWVNRTWSDGLWRVQIRLTPAASSSQRTLAYSLNLDCLSRIGGCKGAKELLPTIE